MSSLAYEIGSWDAGDNVLIHRNQGQSTSAARAMMIMAKYLKTISDPLDWLSNV